MWGSFVLVVFQVAKSVDLLNTVMRIIKRVEKPPAAIVFDV